MCNVIKFFDRIPHEYKMDAMQRAYAKHKQNHNRLQMERQRKSEQAKSEPSAMRQMLIEHFPHASEEELDYLEQTT